MALQGSLETIALPDVLSLLASSTKSGELRVMDRRGEGRLWLEDGRLVGWDVGRAESHVEAVFELLRLATGTFAFEEGVDRRVTGEMAPVDSVIADALARMAEWRTIEAVVPSLDSSLTLSPELPAPEVTVRAEQWAMLVLIANPRSAKELLDELKLSEFTGCLAVKDLVDAGLVRVGPPVVRPAPAPPCGDQDQFADRLGSASAGPEARAARALGEGREPSRVGRPPSGEPSRSVRPLDGRQGSRVGRPPVAGEQSRPARPLDGRQGTRLGRPLGEPLRSARALETVQQPSRLARAVAAGSDPNRLAPLVAEANGVPAPIGPAEPAEPIGPIGPIGQVGVVEPSHVLSEGAGEPFELAEPAAPPSTLTENYQSSGYDDAPGDPQRGRRARRIAAPADPQTTNGAHAPAVSAPPNRSANGHAPDPQRDDEPGEEPINRGLLLKFLSSVRT